MLMALLKDGLLDKLLEFDRWLLIKINHDWSNSFFDAVFSFLATFGYLVATLSFFIPVYGDELWMEIHSMDAHPRYHCRNL